MARRRASAARVVRGVLATVDRVASLPGPWAVEQEILGAAGDALHALALALETGDERLQRAAVAALDGVATRCLALQQTVLQPQPKRREAWLREARVVLREMASAATGRPVDVERKLGAVRALALKWEERRVS